MRFVPEAGVVLVHLVRAEHLARALDAVAMRAAAPPAPPPMAKPAHLPTPPPAGPVRSTELLAVKTKATSRSCDIVGWLVIVAGAAVFVAALVAPLDDAALVVALMLAVRAGRLMVGNEVPMLIKSSPRAAVHQMAQIGKNTDSAPWRGT